MDDSSSAQISAMTRAADAARGQPSAPFPIIGIGASAGGLAAFQAFFSGLPRDGEPGMAFVLVQHLSPDHHSLLAELIRTHTRLPVCEVTDGMRVQINTVYIIPPRHNMALLDGVLHLLEPSTQRGQRLPIDHFFQSLAEDQQERAVGIVLSGSGHDGTLGLRAIKGRGGMAMTQSLDSCEYDSMPRSAMATGLMDYQLPPVEMAAQLIRYVSGLRHAAPLRQDLAPVNSDILLKKVFVLLRSQTGHDFSNYKPSTIQRRVERRLAVQQVDSLDNYLKFLQQTPAEVDALFHDLLIGVTQFFRDAELFQVLEETVLPPLLASRPPHSTVRVWSAGCSTGEEAYSLAMLVQEQLERQGQGSRVQVFATDLDGRAIGTARAGLYPESIADDLTPERLRRFFVADPEGKGYRVSKGLRELLVFSEHDLIKDPPFSRLDLLVCRNLLIYLNADLQKRLIPMFHYALAPGGVLFLGSSEGISDANDLFSVLDRKAKIYQRKDPTPALPRVTGSRPLASALPFESSPSPTRPTMSTPTTARPPLRELAEQAILQHLAPVSALVNAQGDILYLHGRSGQYLEPMVGEAGVNNMLKMAREGLRRELTSALMRAVSSQQPVQVTGLSIATAGAAIGVDLSIHPVPLNLGGNAGAAGRPTSAGINVAAGVEPLLYLVMLRDRPDPGALGALADAEAKHVSAPDSHPSKDLDARIAALTLELRTKDDYLQSTLEELESSNEELKSSNEEMQSVNEELQSTNEELETSKEELQSVNEELATVNTELHTKVADLSRANNDMNNLLAGTGIGTVFVDHQLRILRFTPAAAQFINLIASDTGRPVSHIVSNLKGYDALVRDVQAVLDTLQPKAVEVQTTDGKWCTMRVQPYRTLDNVIEGAVITFTDITETIQVREQLRLANSAARLAAVLKDAHDAITLQDLNGQTLAWNAGATRLYGWSELEALQLNVRSRIPPEQDEPCLLQPSPTMHEQPLAPYASRRLDKAGELMTVWVTATALVNASGQVYAVTTTERLQT